MANKIARGTTGQADFLSEFGTLTSSPFVWDVSGTNGSFGGYGNNGLENGWDVVEGGIVTVPSNAPDDVYIARRVQGPDNYVLSYQFEVVCITAELDLTLNTDSSVYTATAAPDGGAAPFAYAWSLPPNATDISGSGNTRQFKSVAGGAVSVTISDGDTPNPCTAEATVNTGAATPEAPDGGSIVELGGYAPTLAPTPGGDTATHKAFAFSEPYVGFATPAESENAPCAGLNIAFHASKYFCINTLDKRRVDAQNAIIPGQEFEIARAYNSVAGTNGTVLLPRYATETHWELAVRGDYALGQEGAEYDAALNPRAQFNSNGNAATYSNSMFIVVPATEGAPVDPILPPDPDPDPDPDPTTTDENGCCLPGYYRTIAGGPCIPVPTGPIDPPLDPTLGVPAAPTLARNCAAATLIVTTPAFPNNAVKLELQRDDGEAIVHLFAAVGAWSDAGAAILTDYRYRCRGVGADGGRGEWGAYCAPLALRSKLTLQWQAPNAGAIVGSIIPLRARVTRPAGAPAASGVTFFVNGAAHVGERSHGDTAVWVWLLDARDFEFQGDISLAAFVTDAGGCRSDNITRTVRLNSSLRRDTTHFDLLLNPKQIADLVSDNRRVRGLALVGEFVPGAVLGLAPAHDSYWRAYLSCPDAGALAPGDELSVSLEDYAVAKFNKPMLMQGDNLDETARARVVSSPVEVAVKWQTGCDRISKIRLLPGDDEAPENSPARLDSLGIFGRGSGTRRAAWFRFDEDGLHLGVDLDAALLGDAFDAIQTVTGDVVVVAPDGLFVVDPLHPLDFTQQRKPAGEAKPARGIERAGELVYFWFGDANNTTIYARDGATLAARGSVAMPGEFVRSFAVRGIVLFCVSHQGQYQIYRFEAGADVPEPVLVYSSGLEVTTLHAFTARAGETNVPAQVAQTVDLLARWGDADGNIRETDVAGAAITRAALGAPVRALGLFRGADLEARGVAGAGTSQPGATLWRQNNNGAYDPERGWPQALEISALHRLEISTGTEENPAFDESLVGGTQGTADDEAFVFRVQASEKTRDRGVLVGDLGFGVTATAPV